LQSCIHKKDNRQFAQIKLNSEADKKTLLDQNHTFLFNRFIMINGRSDLIVGTHLNVCKTCGWDYVPPSHDTKLSKWWCAECLRARAKLDALKERVIGDFFYGKEDILNALKNDKIHPRNIHRRLYLTLCEKRSNCHKRECNFAHTERELFLGQVVNEYRQIAHDMASDTHDLTSDERSGAHSAASRSNTSASRPRRLVQAPSPDRTPSRSRFASWPPYPQGSARTWLPPRGTPRARTQPTRRHPGPPRPLISLPPRIAVTYPHHPRVIMPRPEHTFTETTIPPAPTNYFSRLSLERSRGRGVAPRAAAPRSLRPVMYSMDSTGNMRPVHSHEQQYHTFDRGRGRSSSRSHSPSPSRTTSRSPGRRKQRNISR